MWIAQVTTPVRRCARLAAYRFLGAPIRSDWKRRDCEPGDRSPPRAVVSFGCPVYVVAVPGVGPVVPSNFPFFDVVIGVDDKKRLSWRLTRTWRYHRDHLTQFLGIFSMASVH